jgi:hypothetical protein
LELQNLFQIQLLHIGITKSVPDSTPAHWSYKNPFQIQLLHIGITKSVPDSTPAHLNYKIRSRFNSCMLELQNQFQIELLEASIIVLTIRTK